jgi:hypothetical protein
LVSENLGGRDAILGRDFLFSYDVVLDLAWGTAKVRNPKGDYLRKKVIKVLEGQEVTYATCIKQEEIPPSIIRPHSMKVHSPKTWERRQVAILPRKIMTNSLVPARTLSVVDQGKVWTPLLNVHMHSTVTTNKQDKVARIVPVQVHYEKHHLSPERHCDDCINFIQEQHHVDEASDLTSCGTAPSIESNFPVEFEDGHHVLKDPSLEDWTKHLPDVSHLENDPRVTKEEYERTKDILRRNAEIFARTKNDLGCTHWIQHEIDLKPGSTEHRESLRRLAPEKLRQANEQLDALITMGVVVPSRSPWASAIVMAKKKGSQLRMCIDFRGLNEVTIKDAFPLPRIDDSIAKLGSAKYFSGVDVSNAFWQIPLREEDQHMTAFAVMRQQLFKG